MSYTALDSIRNAVYECFCGSPTPENVDIHLMHCPGVYNRRVGLITNAVSISLAFDFFVGRNRVLERYYGSQFEHKVSLRNAI